MGKTLNSRPVSYGPIKMAGIIVCTLFYFLIFAQFSYLHCLTAIDPESQLRKVSLCCMGFGGLFGCLLVAKKHRLDSFLYWLLAGFAGCMSCALLVLIQPAKEFYPLLGLGIGIFLSILAVSTATILPIVLPKKHIGIWTGSGVGSAYFLCNMPIIFHSTPLTQCIYAASACIIGSLLCRGLDQYILKHASKQIGRNKSILPTSRQNCANKDRREKFPMYEIRGLWVVVIFLLALVWYDSAAFYIIQEKIQVSGGEFENGLLHWKNGIVHLLSALVAGWVLDRKWIFGVLFFSLFGLLLGMWGVQNSEGYLWAALYVASVSGYSTVLVAFVALAGQDNLPTRIQAALIYAIGGWFGSVLGIIMAIDLHKITWLFAATSLAMCIGAKIFDIFAPARFKAIINRQTNR